MPRVRLGVALLVPPPLDAEVDGLRRACGDGSLGRIPPHLTLVPPVNVREDRLGDALALLRRAAAACPPLRLRLGPPATFWPATPVLYLAVGGEPPAVAALHALRDAVFTDPLVRPLTWPFVPHVTLAEEATPERLAAAVAGLADYAAEVTFGRVHLLRERKDPDAGRVWQPLADADLAPPAVIGRGGLPVELVTGEWAGPDAVALSEREWAALGGTPRSGWVVTARREGEVVGVARGWVDGDLGYLKDLVVAAAVRGQGVGSHLVAAVASRAAEAGCGRLAVRTVAGGPAERFYRDRGFAEEVRLPSWRNGRDLVQLSRRL